MTKKDYELVAKVINKELAGSWALSTQVQKEDMVQATKDIIYGLAVAFQTENPLFNRSKFLTACGLFTDIPCARCGGKRDAEALICNACGVKESL
jgi:hypothetical protein